MMEIVKAWLRLMLAGYFWSASFLTPKIFAAMWFAIGSVLIVMGFGNDLPWWQTVMLDLAAGGAFVMAMCNWTGYFKP